MFDTPEGINAHLGSFFGGEDAKNAPMFAGQSCFSWIILRLETYVLCMYIYIYTLYYITYIPLHYAYIIYVLSIYMYTYMGFFENKMPLNPMYVVVQRSTAHGGKVPAILVIMMHMFAAAPRTVQGDFHVSCLCFASHRRVLHLYCKVIFIASTTY